MKDRVKIKFSPVRSEIRMFKGKSKINYLVIKFKDDKNKNSEYHVFAEVQAMKAASDFSKKINKKFKPSMNSRQKWDIVWREK